MSKFGQRLAQDEKAVKAGAAKLAEANAKAQVEQKISSLTARKATLEQAYEAAFSTSFSIDKVFALTAEMKQNEIDLALATSILKSEFVD